MYNFTNKTNILDPIRKWKVNQTGYIDPDYYIFDDVTVRTVLFSLYTIVFVFCFVGNLLVVLVVTNHWKMRSITKYCIGNLAMANMCVGIFCVYQNFFMYIIGSWPFGDFLCKMFHFVNSLSHTASILILVVISIERYFVVLHPFKCRRILTINRLRLIILGVWILSGILCLPKLLYVILIRNPQGSEDEVTYDIICSIGTHLFASETWEMIQFLLLFILPLLIISILYYKVAKYLRQREAFNETYVPGSLFEYEPTEMENSSQHLENNSSPPRNPETDNTIINMPDLEESLAELNRYMMERLMKRKLQRFSYANWRNRNKSSSSNHSGCSNCRKHRDRHKKGGENCFSTKSKSIFKQSSLLRRRAPWKEPRRSLSLASISCQSNLIRINFSGSAVCCRECGFFCCHSKISSPHRSHKDVVKLLVVIVVTFALCNFPYHLRKIYQNYFYKPENESDWDELATPITFLLMYANCAINPIVYGFMSKSFRACLMDVAKCNCRRPSQCSIAR